jgi:hypothetical protein
MPAKRILYVAIGLTMLSMVLGLAPKLLLFILYAVLVGLLIVEPWLSYRRKGLSGEVKFKDQWSKVRAKGRARFVLRGVGAWIAGGGFAILARYLDSYRHGPTGMPYTQALTQFGLWAAISPVVVLGELWHWERSEKRYLVPTAEEDPLMEIMRELERRPHAKPEPPARSEPMP